MSFFNELKRRNVIRVGIAYVIVAWLILQFADVVLNNIHAPDWVFQAIMLLLGIGLPIVVIFAWAFEMTPEGIKKEKDVDRTQSITRKTGRKLDFTIIGIMAIALTYFIWESRFQPSVIPTGKETPATIAATGTEISDQAPDSSEITITRDNSIAVLPFANRSDKASDLYFTDGIHDDLLTQLAKISGLKVTSRTSVMEYRDTTKKIPEIAAELGVSTILEGGIQRAGDRIRINAQLIDVNTDEHLWAETFDREMTVENIFDIQSEIARHIVTAVRGELSAEESEVLAQLPTHSLAAYEAYLQAKNVIKSSDYSLETTLEAEAWVQKAIDYDPEFALAWAMMVSMHGQAIWQDIDDSPERYRKVNEALKKASQLGPFLPETLAARAEYMYRIENNFHEAEIANRAAIKAKPGDAELRMQLGYTLRRTGKWEESVSAFQLALELDPDSHRARTMIVETLMIMNEFERAEPLINLWAEKYPQALTLKTFNVYNLIYQHGDIAAARNWFDQIEPSPSAVYLFAAVLLPMYERDYPAAIEVWDRAQWAKWQGTQWFEEFKLVSQSEANLFAGNIQQAEALAQKAIGEVRDHQAIDVNKAAYMQILARAHVQIGEKTKALELVENARELVPESRDSLRGPGIAYTHVRIMAMAGQRDEALEEIARLLNTPGGMTRWDLYLHPQWDFFRDDERFNDLIRPPNLKEGVK